MRVLRMQASPPQTSGFFSIQLAVVLIAFSSRVSITAQEPNSQGRADSPKGRQRLPAAMGERRNGASHGIVPVARSVSARARVSAQGGGGSPAGIRRARR